METRQQDMHMSAIRMFLCVINRSTFACGGGCGASLEVKKEIERDYT